MEHVITILIVDDHKLVRTGLNYILSDEEDITVIGEAKSGEEAIKLTKELSPEIVLLDIEILGIDGLTVVKKILQTNSKQKILVLTAHKDDVYLTKFFRAGVLGYIIKDESLEQLVHAVRSVYSGKRYISPHFAKDSFLKELDIFNNKPFDKLSDRELQVALLVSRGFSAPEIAKKLKLKGKTINNYRYRVFKKLHIKGDVELVRLTIRHGIGPVFNPAWY